MTGKTNAEKGISIQNKLKYFEARRSIAANVNTTLEFTVTDQVVGLGTGISARCVSDASYNNPSASIVENPDDYTIVGQMYRTPMLAGYIVPKKETIVLKVQTMHNTNQGALKIQCFCM
jgi:hypothetical protein